MKQIKSLLCLLPLLAALNAPAQVWTGNINSDWSNPGNWNTGEVPSGPIIASSAVNWPVLSSSLTVTELTMLPGSHLDLNGFTLTAGYWSGWVQIEGAILSGGQINLIGDGRKSLEGSTINGHLTINLTGNGELDESGNTFNGDLTMNLDGSAGFLAGGTAASAYHGHLTVKRSVAGSTNLFKTGFKALDGNLTYTNAIGGSTLINQLTAPTSVIGGKVNINYTPTTGGPEFSMNGLRNTTPGGTVIIRSNGVGQNISGVYMSKDSLVIDSLVLRNVLGVTLSMNTIRGNVVVWRENIAPLIMSTLALSNNSIHGSCLFSVAGGNYAFSEGGNTHQGDVDYRFSGDGIVMICSATPSAFHGDLSINSSRSGDDNIFVNGFTALEGDFTYLKTGSGAAYINKDAFPTAMIGGAVNIHCTPAVSMGEFTMSRIKNATGGGSISVQNSGTVKFLFDTLVVNDLSVTGFTNTGGESGFLNNQVTGNLLFSDAGINTGEVYIYGNTFTGNAGIKMNAAANLYQGYYTKDVFNGNLLVERNGTGNISLSFTGPIYVNGDLTLKSSAGITFTDTVNFGGAGAAFKQLGTQPVTIPKMRMQKATTASLSLLSPVTISNKLTFVSGIIDCSITPLYFADNAAHEGATAASHAKGEVVKTGNDAFTFPLGSGTTLNTIAITAPANTTDAFSARYYARHPGLDGFDTKLFQKVTATPVQLVSGCEYWNLSRLNGNATVGLTFAFGQSICPGGSPAYITDPAKMRIVHWNGSLWEDLGNGGHTGATAGTLTTGAAVGNFSPFTLASTDVAANPLPLTLLSFRAYRKEPGVQLEWETVNEVNVSHYAVQRAGNNHLFATIDSIPAFNTPERHRYKTLDLSPLRGNNYYRLKNIDKDGRTTVGKTVLVKMEQLAGLQLWPNPVYRGQPVRLLMPGNTLPDLVLINSQGQVARRWKAFHTASPLPVSDLPAGVYLLQVHTNSEVQTLKIVIR